MTEPIKTVLDALTLQLDAASFGRLEYEVGSQIKKALALNHTIPPSIAALLANENDTEISEALSWNPFAGEAAMGILAAGAPRVRTALAGNCAIPRDLALSLSADRNIEVRVILASCTPWKPAQEVLLNDAQVDVRIQAANSDRLHNDLLPMGKLVDSRDGGFGVASRTERRKATACSLVEESMVDDYESIVEHFRSSYRAMETLPTRNVKLLFRDQIDRLMESAEEIARVLWRISNDGDPVGLNVLGEESRELVETIVSVPIEKIGGMEKLDEIEAEIALSVGELDCRLVEISESYENMEIKVERPVNVSADVVERTVLAPFRNAREG
jgi:hypothetical protein